eukprot:gene13362-17041_t
MTDHVLVERPDAYPGVQVIRLNRPEKKNAITRDMYAKMTNALTVAGSDPAVRVTAFLGTDGCFSAGNDMADFLAFAMGGSMGTEVIDFLKALARAAKPVVSGVDGLAIGNGILTTRKDKGGEAAKAAIAIRYSVVERGGRLVVIDTQTGQTPPTAAERMDNHDRALGVEPIRPART